MPAMGIALLWAGYAIGAWGYCLLQGYNITVKELMSSTWPPPKKTGPGTPAATTPTKPEYTV